MPELRKRILLCIQQSWNASKILSEGDGLRETGFASKQEANPKGSPANLTVWVGLGQVSPTKLACSSLPQRAMLWLHPMPEHLMELARTSGQRHGCVRTEESDGSDKHACYPQRFQVYRQSPNPEFSEALLQCWLPLGKSSVFGSRSTRIRKQNKTWHHLIALMCWQHVVQLQVIKPISCYSPGLEKNQMLPLWLDCAVLSNLVNSIAEDYFVMKTDHVFQKLRLAYDLNFTAYFKKQICVGISIALKDNQKKKQSKMS